MNDLLRNSRESRSLPDVLRPLGVMVGLVLLAGSVFSQTPAPAATAAPVAPTEQATVPTSQANVHKGPSSGQVLLVIVPKGTVMPILGRKGEWVQVRLTPELRKTSIVIRWYENEDSGWMHDSTVQITPISKP
jgi:uncharacterized protein YgiM (DUF1202 family)